MEYDNEMTGVLFVNDKGNNPKRPDYWGRLTLGGTEYKLAGWKKVSDKQGTYLSLKVELKDDAPKPVPPSQPNHSVQELTDEIPF